ncbi:MAG: hypothetical protein GMKNLPBB_02068 [Myxococcota bacterium]|nr:hypothetical protein [Myxococcota bacterium]
MDGVKVFPRDLLASCPAGWTPGQCEEALHREGFTLGYCPRDLADRPLQHVLTRALPGHMGPSHASLFELLCAVEGFDHAGAPLKSVVTPRSAAGPAFAHGLLALDAQRVRWDRFILRIYPILARTELMAFSFPSVQRAINFCQSLIRQRISTRFTRLLDGDNLMGLAAGLSPGALVLMELWAPRRLEEVCYRMALDLAARESGESQGPALAHEYLEAAPRFEAAVHPGDPQAPEETLTLFTPWTRVPLLFQYVGEERSHWPEWKHCFLAGPFAHEGAYLRWNFHRHGGEIMQQPRRDAIHRHLDDILDRFRALGRYGSETPEGWARLRERALGPLHPAFENARRLWTGE